MADDLPGLDHEPQKGRARPSWCQCVRNRPYTAPNWDIWVSDTERAFCRGCGRDVYSAAAGQLNAHGCDAESVEEARFKLVERWEDCPLCGQRFRRARDDWWLCLSCALLGDVAPG